MRECEDVILEVLSQALKQMLLFETLAPGIVNH
jgi:hypothetical protein